MLLVDDDEIQMKRLVESLAAMPCVNVVAKVASGGEAVAEMKRIRPDLVLTKVEMPRMSGFQLAQRISEMADAPRVVVMSANESDNYRELSRMAGADAFIPVAELCDLLSLYLRTRFKMNLIPGSAVWRHGAPAYPGVSPDRVRR